MYGHMPPVYASETLSALYRLNRAHFLLHITFKVGDYGALYVWKHFRIAKKLNFNIQTSLRNLKIGPAPKPTISQT
jgi:hypothetical protein